MRTHKQCIIYGKYVFCNTNKNYMLVLFAVWYWLNSIGFCQASISMKLTRRGKWRTDDKSRCSETRLNPSRLHAEAHFHAPRSLKSVAGAQEACWQTRNATNVALKQASGESERGSRDSRTGLLSVVGGQRGGKNMAAASELERSADPSSWAFSR